MLRTIEKALKDPAYRAVCRQGRFLVEVAALQRGNVSNEVFVREVMFKDERVDLTLQWPTGASWTLSIPILAAASDIFATAVRYGSLSKPILEPGEDFPADPHPSPGVMYTGLLLDLGVHADALVTYRLDADPLVFDSVASYGGIYTDVVVCDRKKNRYRMRYTWAAIERPIVGDAYLVSDTVADGGAALANEGYTDVS